ncbi:hypothetical protein [Streptomyces alkaliphilus]|nr:hypothetical protein [Streptomyces alkaliphilus]
MAPDSRRWWTEMVVGLGTTTLLALALALVLVAGHTAGGRGTA